MPRPFVEYTEADRLQWHSPLELLIDLFRWLLIVGLTLLVMALLHGWLGERPGHQALQLRHAWLQLSGSPLLPEPSEGAWQEVELPHDWRGLPELRGETQGWYRFKFNLDERPSDLWGVYLPSLSMNAAVYVNGELLGQGGRFEPQLARNWNRPLYFTLPGSLLVTGDNFLMLRLAAAPSGTGLLAPVYLGPHQALEPFHSRRHFLKVTVPIIGSLATALLALAALLIHGSRRDERVYRWFGVGTLIWSVHNLNLIVANPPLGAAAWDWLWYVSLGWFILMIPPYVHALLGYERPNVEKALFAYGAAGSMVLAGLAVWDHAWFDWAARHVWDPVALAIGVYPTFMMAQAVWRSRDVEIQWLLTTGLLIFVLGTHDLLAIVGLISRVDGYMIQYSAPLVIAVFGWLLLSRFVRSITEVEALNEDLQNRVEERSRELERSFETMSRMTRDQAIQAERERILRDMHDGVGGSLVAALSLAECGELQPADMADVLRDSLDELRLTIDSLDLEQGDLDYALANLKARLQPVLDSGATPLQWDCGPLPKLPALGPERLTDLVRIVREAISNALRHAQADTVRFRAAADVDSVRIEVADDGRGIENLEQAGHGLNNMRRRAKRIGASLEILSSRQGTRIILSLPRQSG